MHMLHSALRTVGILLVVLIFTGCATRSISNSGYQDERKGMFRECPTPSSSEYSYRGELDELDVLGIGKDTEISNETIAEALASAKSVSIPRGGKVLLVQSGARIPDAEMTVAVEKNYHVSVFSGVPNSGIPKANYSNSLRLAAAQGGNDVIVAYWGVLESQRNDLDSKTVSWVPIVGSVIPDEDQVMRINLKVAVIDVATGAWDMFSPESYGDASWSSRISREASDQEQVRELKLKAYSAAAEQLKRRYEIAQR